MKLPNLTQVQFQSAAQSQEFDPLKLPDPNPSLQQNLAAIQGTFDTLAQDDKLNAGALYADSTGEGSLTETIGKFSELLPQAVKTLTDVQNVDVAIQMARADDQYYQMLRQGLIPQNAEMLAIEQNEKDIDNVTRQAAARASEIADSYDVPRGILNFSNHGQIALKRRIAGHMFQNVYPEWMATQLEVNDTEVMVRDENNELVPVKINQKGLPDFQFKQIMSHLRTAFMGHELLADVNNDLIQREMTTGFTVDAQLERAYSRQTRGTDGDTRFKSGVTNLMEQIKLGNYAALAEFQVDAKSMWSKDGKTLTNTPTRFFQRLKDYVSTVALNGAELPIGKLLNEGVLEDGQRFIDRAPAKAGEILRVYRENITKYRTNKRKADKAEIDFDTTQFVQSCLESGQCTMADIIDKQDEITLKSGEAGVPAAENLATLARIGRLATVEGEQLTELDKAARLAIETGQVSLDADYALNPVIYNRYKDKLEGIAARRDSQEFKDGSTRIEKAVKGKHGKLVDPKGDLTEKAFVVNNHYQRIYTQEYDRLVAANAALPPAEQKTKTVIAREATELVLGMWRADSTDETNDFYVNPKNGNFDNFPEEPLERAKTAQRTNMVTLAEESKTTKGISEAIVKNPSLIFQSAEETTEALRNFLKTGLIGKDIEYKRNVLNDTLGVNVIPKPEALILAAAVGYGVITPEQAKTAQNPYILRNASAQQAHMYRLKRRAIRNGQDYLDPAQFGPVNGMAVRPGFENLVASQPPGDTAFPQQTFRRAPKGQHRFLVTVGINEGNRTFDGGYTRNWDGHVDPATGGPARGRRNVGSVSYGGFQGSPAEADAIFNRRFAALEQQYAPKLSQLGVRHGTKAYEALMFNIADLTVQAPAAVPDFVKQFPALIKQGLSMQTIGKARADSFIVNGKLQAAGFGNNYNTLLRDQEARAMTFQLLRRGR